ncbi:MAG: N-acetylneuraminate synthase family protein [bacterium]|nr:N-acetylneuraminate synthase family protein [bacterium]
MDFSAKTKFDFENLFTFELANNHQGSVEHGKRIIREMGLIAKEFGIRAATKIQLRDLNSFIHPAYVTSKEHRHIGRFLGTRLTEEEFAELVDEMRKSGLITMATPFDEESVDAIERLGVEIVKVASCSSEDWPLLEKIATLGKPVIASVGGLTLREIDKVVSFFEHRGADFALMHCVGIYPTPAEELHLNQIELMRERYPQLTIGFSTHESPDNYSVIGLAYAKGARIFEKHVGIPTETIKLNAYSANPDEVRAWVQSYKNAVASCGPASERTINESESRDMQSLKRGVFAKSAIRKGQTILHDDVFFAMPMLGVEYLESGKFKNPAVADKDYLPGEPLAESAMPRKFTKKDVIYSAVREAKAMLNIAKVPLSHDFTVEISHHYGLENFNKIGCIIIDCINREYARKLVIQFAGQFHPIHYHKIKDESFHILSGSMEAEVEGKKKMLYPGDTLWVPRGVWHSFWTNEGVIFEEISTTSMESNGDSYYIDKNIASQPREGRKTKLLNWGRYQFESAE